MFAADHILSSKVIQTEKITNRESHQVMLKIQFKRIGGLRKAFYGFFF